MARSAGAGEQRSQEVGCLRGVEPLLFQTEADPSRGIYAADWIVLTRDTLWPELPEVWNAGSEVDDELQREFAELRPWTDDYSNLYQLLLP